jgi:hypothetical protein
MSDIGTKVALGQIKALGGVNYADLITSDLSNLDYQKTMESLFSLRPEFKKDSYSNSISKIASGYALGKFVDTNNNPNAMKTAGVVFGGGIIGDFVHSFALRKMLGSKGSPIGITAPNMLDMGASLLNAYHGYQRHDSFGFGLLWFLFGGSSGLGVAISQGFSEPLNRSNPHCVPNPFLFPPREYKLSQEELDVLNKGVKNIPYIEEDSCGIQHFINDNGDLIVRVTYYEKHKGRIDQTVSDFKTSDLPTFKYHSNSGTKNPIGVKFTGEFNFGFAKTIPKSQIKMIVNRIKSQVERYCEPVFVYNPNPTQKKK